MLSSLFYPQAIAVIGASKDEKKVGYSILHNLLRFEYHGKIYPVNPAGGEILGLQAYPTISAIPGKTDLAVIAIPARAVPTTLIECSTAGIKSVVILSAGFKETGQEGTQLEDKIKQIAKEHNIRMLGPNCLGLINTSNNMNASFAADMLPKGNIAFFSQSGALGIAILDWAIGNQIGFSKFISLGNKADLNEIDFIEYFIQDDETSVILGYIEDVVDGKRFLEAAGRATKVKPIVLVKSGGTAAGARAASSHTGALAGSDTAFDAAFKQTGIVRAPGIEDLFSTAVAFSGKKLPAGDRLLIITNAGGPGIMAADAAERLGLKLPQMTRESIDALAKLLPANASLYNPVDIIGDATSDRYSIALERAVVDPNVDGILVVLTPQAMTDVDNVAKSVIAISQKSDKPVITSFMGEARVRSAVDAMKARSVPSFSYPETAVKAFKRLSDYNQWKHVKDEEITVGWFNEEAVQDIVDDFLNKGIYQLGEEDAMRMLTFYGFTFPKRALVRTSREAAQVAAGIGFPIVMKISSPDILHKTDVGGVRVNVKTPKEAEDAFQEITANAKRRMPNAFIKGAMIFEMIKGGKETILGVTQDRTFGPMIMFGLGGIYVEVLKDVSFRIAPLARRDALAMVHEIKSIGLLQGARGERPSDLSAIADNIVRLSAFIADFPEVQELDINPLMVMEKGAVALDARIILRHYEAKQTKKGTEQRQPGADR